MLTAEVNSRLTAYTHCRWPGDILENITQNTRGSVFFLFIPIPGLLILFKYFKVCTKMFSYTNMPATCRCFYSTKLELLGLEALLFSTPLNFINLKRFIQCDSRLLTAKSGKNGLLHRWDHTCVLLKHCHRTAAGQSACPTGHRLCQTLFNLLNFTPFGP